MKRANEFPVGWSEQRVREVLEHYENQTDEDAVAEHEAALLSPEHTMMEVPVELVPLFRQLIAKYEKEQTSP